MAKCPTCGHQNIDGADYCEQCQADLFDLGMPRSTAEGLGQRLLEDSILELHPELMVTVTLEQSVEQVVRIMSEKNATAVMVVDQDKLVGVFTERDFLMKIVDRYDELRANPISKFMTSNPESLEAKDSIAFGLNRMAVKNYRHIPIVENSKPIALVRTRDVLNYIAMYCPEVA